MNEFLICVRDDGAVLSQFRKNGVQREKDKKKFWRFVKGHDWTWVHWLYKGSPQGGHGREFKKPFKELSDALRRDLETISSF